MDITIYLLCYNEEVMLPHTLDHYFKRFPRASILIIDNESTDRSVEIAKARGCHVISWDTGNESNIIKHTELKNTIWKSALTDWVIVADMDEWAEITEADLLKEDSLGSTILHFNGVQMVGKSESVVLDDIDLHALKTGYLDKLYNKHVCFKRTAITEMNYSRGAHTSSEKGIVKYGKTVYKLKHMNFLGLPWFREKMIGRFKRTVYNRTKLRCSGHYTNRESDILAKYNRVVELSKVIL